MQSPFDRLAAQYRAHPRADTFENYVLWYLRHGFAFVRPDFVAIGRPVIASAPAEDILDDRHLFHSSECDCWYLFACAGNMARMWQVMPYRMKWFCWTRITDPEQELQFVETSRLERLCPPDLNQL